MILQEVKRDTQLVNVQGSYRMNISKSAESHVIKILTEHSYKDKLGSAIRETLSNCVDSHIEAGVSNPIIVKLQKDSLNNWELSFIDVGLGLNHEEFDKYIMGIGESTKQNNPDVIGGFGAGAKSVLSYVDSFQYVCRKNDWERKFLIYKGEKFPDRMLIYEKETQERNGVTVSFQIKYEDRFNVKEKIKAQCSYFDNVYYDIPDFDNTYKIYRSSDFEWNDLYNAGEMHISLKGVTYPISWSELGLYRINVPIALKFDNYDSIRPIFNREEIEWNKETIEIVKNQIKKVADFFVSKYNENTQEAESLFKGWKDINPSSRCVTLQDKQFHIDELLKFTDIKCNEIKIKGLNYLTPSFFKNNFDRLVDKYTIVGEVEYNGRLTQKNVTRYKYNLLDYRCVLVDTNITGFFRDYLKSLRPKYIVKEHVVDVDLKFYKQILHLDKFPRKDWRGVITEWETVKKGFGQELLKDWTKLHLSKEFLDYKERNRAIQVSQGGGHKVLDKQQGEVTIGFAVPREIGKGFKIEKDTYEIAKIHQMTYNTVVFEVGQEDLCKQYAEKFDEFRGRVKFAVIGKRELTKIKSKKFYMWAKLEERPSELKLFRNVATASLFSKVIKDFNAISANATQLIKEYLTPLHNDVTILRDYAKKYNAEIDMTVINKAYETNDFDFSLWKEFKNVEKATKELSFLRFYQKPESWRTIEMEEFTKFINEEILMRKSFNPSNFENLQICITEPININNEEKEVV